MTSACVNDYADSRLATLLYSINKNYPTADTEKYALLFDICDKAELRQPVKQTLPKPNVSVKRCLFRR